MLSEFLIYLSPLSEVNSFGYNKSVSSFLELGKTEVLITLLFSSLYSKVKVFSVSGEIPLSDWTLVNSSLAFKKSSFVNSDLDKIFSNSL